MAVRPIRIAVQLQPEHATYETIRDSVRRIEDLGVDVLFNWDHFFPLDGDPDGLHFESWTMLGAIAEQTSRIEFGALVNCNSYRNPDLQADMARTLDRISAKGTGVGRFLFGTGAGWFERDYVEYGYGFPTPGQRLDDLEAALPRIRARWEVLNPPPTRRIPILIGGSGPRRTLRLVAEHADIWHSFSRPELLRERYALLLEHCAAVGRDPGEIEISVENRSGGLEKADALHELGATLFTVGIHGPDYPLEAVERMLAWRDSMNA